MENDCPSCSRQFDTEHGVKVHHTFEHGESLAKQERTCQNCGCTFSEFQSRIERGKGKFCSKECQKENSRITFDCAYCGKEASKPLHRANRYENLYCSRQCYQRAYSEMVRDTENHPSYEGGPEIVECDNCGIEMELYVHHIHEENFCSIECRDEVWSGEDHPTYIHGEGGTYYGPSWEQYREEALDAAGYECERCGIADERHQERHGRGLEVHHETPVRTFDELETAHEESELTVYCCPCHNREEAKVTV